MKYPVWFSVEETVAAEETVEAAEAVGTFCGSILYPSKYWKICLCIYIYLFL